MHLLYRKDCSYSMDLKLTKNGNLFHNYYHSSQTNWETRWFIQTSVKHHIQKFPLNHNHRVLKSHSENLKKGFVNPKQVRNTFSIEKLA